MPKEPKFIGTIAYSSRPVAGVTLYTDRKVTEPSLEEMIDELEKDEIRGVKKDLLITKVKERMGIPIKQSVTPGQPNPKRYLVDPESGKIEVDVEEGEYTYKDALLVSSSIKDKRDQTKGTQPAAMEKVSELLTALEPYINKGSNREEVTGILGDKLALLRQEILGHIPQQVASPPPKSWIDQLTELSSALPMLKSILGIPEQSSNPFIPTQITGLDGKPTVMDLTQVLDLRKFMTEERRAEEGHKTKMDIAKGFKDLLGKAGTAMSHTGEEEEE